MPAKSGAARQQAAPAREQEASRRLGLGSFVVALIGLGISVYLTIEHYNQGLTLACPESSAVNCTKVTTSAWSHIGPIPVAVLGLAYFVGMTVLCSPPAWRHRLLDVLRVLGAAVGVLMVLYLVWAELFRIDAICLWCTGVHVCTLLLFGFVLWTTTSISSHGGPVPGRSR
jgi:uncharacterized membrane protein